MSEHELAIKYMNMIFEYMQKTMDAVKTANKTAYTSNTYWKMGFDAAYDAIMYEWEKEKKKYE